MNRLILIVIASYLYMIPSVGFTAGDPTTGQEKSIVCSACHGIDGNSDNSDFPSLAGQVPGYIAQQLANFKLGIRQNPIMMGLAQTLTDDDMADLDAWYSSQKIHISTLKNEEIDMVKLGEELYRSGFKLMEVPSCMGCHGPTGAGIPTKFPRVGGQHPEYTEKQLIAFKSKKRWSQIMSPIAFRLSPEQIRALSLYLSVLR
ncbi:MAG: cytochrome c4 [Acidiferrobacteraceae bacterium]|nr:cytochrome c4 [Acidiferrobacteraceae bacterium]